MTNPVIRAALGAVAQSLAAPSGADQSPVRPPDQGEAYGAARADAAKAQIKHKLVRYQIEEAEILHEAGHLFVPLTKLGLQREGQACLVCGTMRRRDGTNKPCKGPVAVTLR